MARTIMTPVKLGDYNKCSEAIVFQAASSLSDGFALDFGGKDDKIAILVRSSAAGGSFTVLQGDGIQGVADYVSPSIGANELRSLVLESGAFMHMSGDDKGKVLIIPSAASVEIAAIELP